MSVVSIASTKGGVGKTSLAFSLAKDLNVRYITNDMSVVVTKYKHAKYFPKKIPLYENTIYDFGGFVDQYSSEILNQSDVIIVPTICDANSIMKSLKLIKEYQHKTILVFANMIENKKELEFIKESIEKYFPNLTYTHLRRTKLLKNALETGVSASELFNSNNQTQYVYQQAFGEYSKLLRLFQNVPDPSTHQ